MDCTIKSGTLKLPLPYRRPDGRRDVVPPGPCLLELLSDGNSLVIWGEEGEFSARMSNETIKRAVATRQLDLSRRS